MSMTILIQSSINVHPQSCKHGAAERECAVSRTFGMRLERELDRAAGSQIGAKHLREQLVGVLPAATAPGKCLERRRRTRLRRAPGLAEEVDYPRPWEAYKCVPQDSRKPEVESSSERVVSGHSCASSGQRWATNCSRLVAHPLF